MIVVPPRALPTSSISQLVFHALLGAGEMYKVFAWVQNHIAGKLPFPSYLILSISSVSISFSRHFLRFLSSSLLGFAFLLLTSFLLLTFPFHLLPSSSFHYILGFPVVPPLASPPLINFPLFAPVRRIHRDPSYFVSKLYPIPLALALRRWILLVPGAVTIPNAMKQ